MTIRSISLSLTRPASNTCRATSKTVAADRTTTVTTVAHTPGPTSGTLPKRHHSAVRPRTLARRVAAWLSMPALAAALAATAAPADLPAAGTAVPHRADFGSATGVSTDARRVVEWVANTRDNGSRNFIVVDKRAARVYVFDQRARLEADGPALLGAARGDLSVPGIGERPIALVRPEERTTPAGRFMAEPGVNTQGEDVVWVDYDAAVSMHRVRTGKPAKRRLASLASPGIADNRISYGCINLPVQLYETQVHPRVHGGRGAVIYVLPEVLPLRAVFALPAD